MDKLEKYDLAKKIREFEIEVLKAYKEGEIKGSVHCCIGQEYHAVDLISQLKKGDVVISNHRGHGHYLAYTQDFEGLWDKLKKGLSQHLHKDNFYSWGIQGGMTPIACGMAMGMKFREEDNIVLCFIGDGTLGQGILYESLNMAGLWKLPICFVVENNLYAMSTHIDDSMGMWKKYHENEPRTHQNSSDVIEERFRSFGLEELNEGMGIRFRSFPSFMVIDTYRYCGHSASDKRPYRTAMEEEYYKVKDHLDGYLSHLEVLKR